MGIIFREELFRSASGLTKVLVKTMWLERRKKAIEIHINQDKGDILIFMTGQEDIEATCCII